MTGSLPIVDTGTMGFRRVLAASLTGEQARVDALIALAQRRLYAATWPGPHQVPRTLTNSDGQTALPLFTGLDELETTATRFGWRDPDGSLQFKELQARDALRHALARGVHFVVLDIGADHSVEFSREELEPLMSLGSQRPGTDPSAASAQSRAAIREAVHRSGRPARATSDEIQISAAPSGARSYPGEAPKRPLSQPLRGRNRPPSVKPPPVLSANDNVGSPVRSRTPVPGMAPPMAAPIRTGGRGREAAAAATAVNAAASPATRDDLRKQGKALSAPRIQLSDALRLGISASLRAFPEVEWACVVADDSQIPVIGVRVDPSFLNRVAEITDAILGAAEKHGVELQVLLLNNPELVKSAHKSGLAFYPWRK